MRSRLYLVLDLETVPDSELQPAPPRADQPPRKGLPAPLHHKVVCFAAAWAEYGSERIARPDPSSAWGTTWDAAYGDERDLLCQLSYLLSELDPCVVTFSGRRFDMQVLAARCFRNKVALPWYYNQPRFQSPRYRYSEERHLDLCDVLSDYGAGTMGSLDAWARACGMPGKDAFPGVDGSHVEQMIADGRLEDVAKYCVSDVVQLLAVFHRWRLLTGAASPEDHDDAQRALLVRARGGDAFVGSWAERIRDEELLVRAPSEARREPEAAE